MKPLSQLNVKFNVQHVLDIIYTFTTRKTPSGRFLHYIYEDKQVTLSVNSFNGHLKIFVKIAGQNSQVFYMKDEENVLEYHSGKWEQYIENVLYPKAFNHGVATQQERMEQDAAAQDDRFRPAGPIYDRPFDDVEIPDKPNLTRRP